MSDDVKDGMIVTVALLVGSPNHTVIYVPAGTNGTPVITQDGPANNAPGGN